MATLRVSDCYLWDPVGSGPKIFFFICYTCIISWVSSIVDIVCTWHWWNNCSLTWKKYSNILMSDFACRLSGERSLPFGLPCFLEMEMQILALKLQTSSWHAYMIHTSLQSTLGSTHSSVGKASDSWSQGCGFDPKSGHVVVSLSKTLHSHCLVLVKPKVTKNVDPDVKYKNNNKETKKEKKKKKEQKQTTLKKKTGLQGYALFYLFCPKT